jgi:hypothetical protein
LDEINRASLANVLGELILCLEDDKRKSNGDDDWHVQLQYPSPNSDGKESFALPENLYILGTMNSADQSIAKIDYAIRRRFRFLNVPPDPKVLWEEYREHEEYKNDLGILTACLLAVINDQIDKPRLKLGHSYLLGAENSEQNNPAEMLAERIVYDVRPLLREYVRNGDIEDLEDDGITISFQFKDGKLTYDSNDKRNVATTDDSFFSEVLEDDYTITFPPENARDSESEENDGDTNNSSLELRLGEDRKRQAAAVTDFEDKIDTFFNSDDD